MLTSVHACWCRLRRKISKLKVFRFSTLELRSLNFARLAWAIENAAMRTPFAAADGRRKGRIGRQMPKPRKSRKTRL